MDLLQNIGNEKGFEEKLPQFFFEGFEGHGDDVIIFQLFARRRKRLKEKIGRGGYVPQSASGKTTNKNLNYDWFAKLLKYASREKKKKRGK